MTNQNEPDMLLPEGFTCAECWLFKKCESFGVTQGKNTLCDFSPSKFMLDPEKYLTLRSLIKELVSAGSVIREAANYRDSFSGIENGELLGEWDSLIQKVKEVCG